MNERTLEGTANLLAENERLQRELLDKHDNEHKLIAELEQERDKFRETSRLLREQNGMLRIVLKKMARDLRDVLRYTG